MTAKIKTLDTLTEESLPAADIYPNFTSTFIEHDGSEVTTPTLTCTTFKITLTGTETFSQLGITPRMWFAHGSVSSSVNMMNMIQQFRSIDMVIDGTGKIATVDITNDGTDKGLAEKFTNYYNFPFAYKGTDGSDSEWWMEGTNESSYYMDDGIVIFVGSAWNKLQRWGEFNVKWTWNLKGFDPELNPNIGSMSGTYYHGQLPLNWILKCKTPSSWVKTLTATISVNGSEVTSLDTRYLIGNDPYTNVKDFPEYRFANWFAKWYVENYSAYDYKITSIEVVVEAESSDYTEPTPPTPASVGYLNIYSIKDSDLSTLAGLTYAQEPLRNAIVNLYRCWGIPEERKDVEELIKIGSVSTTIKGNKIKTPIINLDCGTFTIPDDSNIDSVQIFLPFLGLTKVDNIVGTTLRITFDMNLMDGNGKYSIIVDNNMIQHESARDGYDFPFKIGTTDIQHFQTDNDFMLGTEFYALITYKNEGVIYSNIPATSSELDKLETLLNEGIIL